MIPLVFFFFFFPVAFCFWCGCFFPQVFLLAFSRFSKLFFLPIGFLVFLFHSFQEFFFWFALRLALFGCMDAFCKGFGFKKFV